MAGGDGSEGGVHYSLQFLFFDPEEPQLLGMLSPQEHDTVGMLHRGSRTMVCHDAGAVVSNHDW